MLAQGNMILFCALLKPRGWADSWVAQTLSQKVILSRGSSNTWTTMQKMLIRCSPKMFWKNDSLGLNAPTQISFNQKNLPYFPKQDNQSSSVSTADKSFSSDKELWPHKCSKAIMTFSRLFLTFQGFQQITLPTVCLFFLSLLKFWHHAHGQSHSFGYSNLLPVFLIPFLFVMLLTNSASDSE